MIPLAISTLIGAGACLGLIGWTAWPLLAIAILRAAHGRSRTRR